MLTWSSCPLLLSALSALDGVHSCLLYDTRLAAVYCGIMYPELRPGLEAKTQEAPLTAEHLEDATLRNARPFVDGQGQPIHRQGQRLAVKIAATHNQIFVREDERVVRHGVHLRFEDGADAFHNVPRSTVHLRHATERVRILHIGPWLVGTLRPFEPRRHVVGGDHRTGLVSDPVDRRMHRGLQAVPGFQGPRAKGVGPVCEARHAFERHHAGTKHHLRAIDERQPLLGTEFKRRPAQLTQSVRRRQLSSVRHHHFPLADQWQHKVRERRQIPGSPQRTLARNHGQHTRIPMVEQALHRCHRHSRMALAQRLDLQQQHGLHHHTRQRLPDPARVRNQQVSLQPHEVVHAGRGQIAKPRVDAIQGVAP